MTRSRHHRRSFTLIEAVAAIVVLTIAIPPMLWSLRQAHTQRVSPAMASTARWLATEKLEDVIADRHSTTRGYGYVTASNYPTEGSVSGFAGYSRGVSISETGPDLSSAGSGYKRITVSVSYTDATDTARTLSIATIVTDY
jgi:hypothetical protein